MKKNKKIVIIGAGPAGLGAGYWLSKLGFIVTILDKEPRVGGMGATINIKNTWLITGHIHFT